MASYISPSAKYTARHGAPTVHFYNTTVESSIFHYFFVLKHKYNVPSKVFLDDLNILKKSATSDLSVGPEYPWQYVLLLPPWPSLQLYRTLVLMQYHPKHLRCHSSTSC